MINQVETKYKNLIRFEETSEGKGYRWHVDRQQSAKFFATEREAMDSMVGYLTHEVDSLREQLARQRPEGFFDWIVQQFS